MYLEKLNKGTMETTVASPAVMTNIVVEANSEAKHTINLNPVSKPHLSGLAPISNAQIHLGFLSDGIEVLKSWVQRFRQRQRLQALDDRLLSDIGLSRYDVEQEVSKWFWQK